MIDAQRAIRTASPEPARAFPGATVPSENKISGAPIEKILGAKGEANNGMFKVTIGRAATHHGAKIGKQMGVNTWAAFAGADEMASVDATSP